MKAEERVNPRAEGHGAERHVNGQTHRAVRMRRRRRLLAAFAIDAVAAFAVAAAIVTPTGHADPNCTEDCGVDKGQYELPPEYIKGGLGPSIDIHNAIVTSHAICDRLNRGAPATRSARSLATARHGSRTW